MHFVFVRPAIVFSLCLSTAALLSAQDAGHGLTARELFYTPPPAKSPSTTPARTTPPATTTRKTPPVIASNTKKTPKVATIPPATTTPPEITTSIVTTPDASPLKVISVVHSAGVPLALRYSILRQEAAGNYVEVDPDTVFHSGDKVKVQVKSNDRAYLYIANFGSSKNWTVLFPNPDINNGNNIVERNQMYEIPGGDDRFTFDEQRGQEKLILMLSRQPIENIDQVIYKMDQTKPNVQPARVMMARADAPISDDLINTMRSGIVSRDLVFERVNDEKKPAKREKNVPQTMEKAVYVANSKTDDSARLIADVVLTHD